MSELSDGVQIILGRMKEQPQEFFGDGGRWNWIFKETLREVLTESEKAAIHEALKQVRRTEITALAAATVLRADETNEETERSPFGAVPVKKDGSSVWK